MGRFRKSSYTHREFHDGKHRFEHWYRDNTVYFITSKVSDTTRAFRTEQAKSVFWNRFDFYAAKYGFVPWVTSLLDNHYRTLGYLRIGENLGPFMRKFHGSVAKLTNDLLPARIVPFWRTAGNKDYFDGCIRNPTQGRRAFKYTKLQAVRAGIVKDYRNYPHTKVNIEIERAIRRATELNAFLESVPYARYDRNRAHRRGRLSDHAPLPTPDNPPIS